jgi:hypothetical protein
MIAALPVTEKACPDAGGPAARATAPNGVRPQGRTPSRQKTWRWALALGLSAGVAAAASAAATREAATSAPTALIFDLGRLPIDLALPVGTAEAHVPAAPAASTVSFWKPRRGDGPVPSAIRVIWAPAARGVMPPIPIAAVTAVRHRPPAVEARRPPSARAAQRLRLRIFPAAERTAVARRATRPHRTIAFTALAAAGPALRAVNGTEPPLTPIVGIRPVAAQAPAPLLLAGGMARTVATGGVETGVAASRDPDSHAVIHPASIAEATPTPIEGQPVVAELALVAPALAPAPDVAVAAPPPASSGDPIVPEHADRHDATIAPATVAPVPAVADGGGAPEIEVAALDPAFAAKSFDPPAAPVAGGPVVVVVVPATGEAVPASIAAGEPLQPASVAPLLPSPSLRRIAAARPRSPLLRPARPAAAPVAERPEIALVRAISLVPAPPPAAEATMEEDDSGRPLSACGRRDLACLAWVAGRDGALARPSPLLGGPLSIGGVRLPEDSAAAERELRCLAFVIYAEAANEGARGMAAVAWVVLNRIGDGDFAASVCHVLGEPGQFEPLRRPRFRAVARAVKAGAMPPFPTPLDERDDILLRTARLVVWKMLDDYFAEDPTGGAQYFLAPAAMRALGRGMPAWTGRLTMTASIGDHHFYRP